MEQSEFQSVISGEEVQVAIKNKLAKSVKWKVPMMVAGNEVPSYDDNSGSIARRLLVFMFNIKVKKGDTQLSKKLEKEIGHILYACNAAYLDAVNKYGSSDIWNIVPVYFKESRDEMAATTNALQAFIKSDMVTIGENEYIKESSFVQVLNEFCANNGFKRIKWSKQYSLGVFSDNGLACKKGTFRVPKNDPNAKFITGYFIKGIDVNREILDFKMTESDEEGSQAEEGFHDEIEARKKAKRLEKTKKKSAGESDE
jgi:phage/plasmid-associated DNA primase